MTAVPTTMSNNTFNLNICAERVIPTPRELKAYLPLTPTVEKNVLEARTAIQRILRGEDKRMLLVCGPCSIHNAELAIDYANRFAKLAAKVSDSIFMVMRTYFEKPRTSTGWKGFINDPYLNDSFQVEQGLHAARQLLLRLGAIGVPVGTEALDPVVPQYLDDLISWTAIGARTTESQTHREMASGLSTPVGFKNGTDGNIDVAINALKSVSAGHHFLGINQDGQCAVMQTRGNPYAHVVLRGGGGKPNYDSVSITQCEQRLQKAGLAPRLVVDCSHGNSMKDHTLQPVVMHDCVHQILEGNRSIIGVMLESHLHDGNQNIPENLSDLKYGVSITDACIGWDVTEKIVLEAAEKVREPLTRRTLL